MHILAIIPARGGSKGIPRKNVKPLAGKPLLAHSIDAARGVPRITRVVVSTDDAEIGAVATQFGAEVVWRPTDISGDKASSESALLHVLEHLNRTEGYTPDLIVFLQCTSPLTRAADIDATISALLDARADTALAVTPFHYFLWGTGPDGNAIGINHDKRVRPLRQDRDPQYKETGAVYVMRTAGFLTARHRFFGHTAMHIMPEERVWEIDEPTDFEIIEKLLHSQARARHADLLPKPVAALVLDFDGVFTDNKVFVDQDGRETVRCDRSDGLGLGRLKATDIKLQVLSMEANPVVAARCRKLGIGCLQGVRDKLPVLQSWAAAEGIPLGNIVYVGNDDNDEDCLRAVGCGVAPADAYPKAKAAAHIILARNGGNGAIRELCDLIDQARRPQV